ncbi:uncharacterized protein LOC113274976 [Papaver somniferum]|uniref:uncharacterized protein LOC113274976 n=1 Tax=Papaver somniferum TaxID=3469 RepID=UPI000E6F6AB5|nr:uncharacterized protein LOC113274976 [Papaver somniferum]
MTNFQTKQNTKNIQKSMFFTHVTGLLHNWAYILQTSKGYCQEARGESSGWSSKEQLELNGAEMALQCAIELSGYNVEFKSDLEQILQLLIGMYAGKKEEDSLIAPCLVTSHQYSLISKQFPLIFLADSTTYLLLTY